MRHPKGNQSMPTSRMSQVLHTLERALLARNGAGLSDGQLLERFASRGDQAAFEALVRRHGPMVWGVCRRVLRKHHDIEDAFQATFLVLVRRAGRVLPREMVANWLYGVAHQTALKARATAARRWRRERQVATMPEPEMAADDTWDDIQPLLDRELSRLPDKYRTLIVLCDLEGKTRKEVARHLKLPEGTVAGRLARARALLARRLAPHRAALSSAALSVLLSREAASASVPAPVLSATIKAVAVAAAGQAATAGIISAPVAALTEGVLQAMLLTKLKIVTAVVVTISLVCFGGGLITHDYAAAYQDGAAEQPVQRKRSDRQFKPADAAPKVKQVLGVQSTDAAPAVATPTGLPQTVNPVTPTVNPASPADAAPVVAAPAGLPQSVNPVTPTVNPASPADAAPVVAPTAAPQTINPVVPTVSPVNPASRSPSSTPIPVANHGADYLQGIGSATSASELSQLRALLISLDRRLAQLEGKAKTTPTRSGPANMQRPVQVGNVWVKGCDKTAAALIQKEVLRIKTGQVLDEAAIRQAQDRLAEYNATVTVLEGSNPSRRDILVTVHPANPQSIFERANHPDAVERPK
jgi:RNA polymerase sigma factor (sigma-70 family)